jgi:signal transduction histidine kinase
MDEEPTRECKALNEQVKLLVKTERRLYGAQRVIEMQLHRLGALTTLATNAGRAGDPDVILELALTALVDVLGLDQAVALVPTKASGARLAAMRAQPGCEPVDRRWSGRAVELPIVDRPLLLMPRSATTERNVGALLEAVNAYFAPRRRGGAGRGAPAIELVVPLRRKSGPPLGLMVLRKLDMAVSLHETRISKADLPFVELVASRVEADVENVLLYRELEAFAAGLEEKVAQRTAELARTNDELALSLRRVRETQAQLVEASKSAALLTLVAGLSHELNNPIGVILGYAQGLLSRTPDPATARQLSAIERQARRCSQLVKAMLGLAANRPMVLDSIPPADLLRRAVADAGRQASERGVRVYVDALPDDLPALLISEESVREALGQLVNNALDATASGGTVSLSARERRRNGIWGVELSVKDSGAGIPRAFLSRVFDPFFTTKPPGKGVGLGLSLVRRSVEAHGGRVDVRSELGRGTTVRVWLPVAVSELRAARQPRLDAERAR